MTNVHRSGRADAREMLDAALAYARQDWTLIPIWWRDGERCGCGDRDCTSVGKHPIIKGGFKSASKDQDQIREWWTRYPHAAIGGRTGAASGIDVLDIDVKGNKNGWHTLADLHAELGEVVNDDSCGGITP